MYKLVFLIITIIFTGCSQKTPAVVVDKIQKSNSKIFEQEDTLIMFALRAEQLKDFAAAANIFETLYVKSLRPEYMHRSLQNRLFLKENKFVVQRVNEISKNSLDDFILVRLKVLALVQDSSFEEALALAVKLVAVSKDEEDYILVSDIYGVQEKFDEAVQYLEGGYSKNYSEKILDKMVIFLYVDLQRKKEALAYLETHTMVHGCSIQVCKRLISFYSNENDAEGLLSAYLRYYRIESKPEVAKKILQIYAYKKEYVKLILFLEESNSDDKMLLQLYISTKNYKKAFVLSKKIYDDTGDVKYLGESAIYEYESQIHRSDKVFLAKISKKFEAVLEQNQASLYLNYYGYILIDHDIDIDKGMKYVKQALQIEPTSSYYLDSLAWGHYKRAECSKAFEIIQKVRSQVGGDDPEVVKHYEMIKKCKGKNKE